MYMQKQLSHMSSSSNPEVMPEVSCSTCLEALVARTAALLERLERERRYQLQRRGTPRPEFRTVAILER